MEHDLYLMIFGIKKYNFDSYLVDFWLLLQIYPSELRLVLCSRVTYSQTNVCVLLCGYPARLGWNKNELLKLTARFWKINSSKWESVMNVVVSCINFIRANGLKHRQFQAFLAELESALGDVLYRTEVRWLSRGFLRAATRNQRLSSDKGQNCPRTDRCRMEMGPRLFNRCDRNVERPQLAAPRQGKTNMPHVFPHKSI